MRVSRSVTVWTFETLVFSGPVSLAGFAKVPGL